MTWIFLALLAPFLWGVSNIFDKFTLDKYSSGVFDFLLYSSFGYVATSLIAVIFFGLDSITYAHILPVVGGGLLCLSYLFYTLALEKEDASYIVPLYITNSIFVLIISLLLGESITQKQLIAFIIVFLGALVVALEEISIDLTKYRKAAILMVPAVLILSVYIVTIDYSLRFLSFSDVFIFDGFGFLCMTLLLAINPTARNQMHEGLRKGSLKKFLLYMANNLIDIGGHLVYKYALLLGTSAAIVAVISGIQPFYVIIMGLLITMFAPQIVTENISKKELVQKIIGTVIIVVGISLLNL